MLRLLLSLIFISWIILHIPILVLTNSLVPKPYMDEPFHFHQAVEIWRNPVHPAWDEKITTPPGLYYVTMAMTAWAEPKLDWLRWTSAVFNSLSVPVIALLLLNHRERAPSQERPNSGMLSSWLTALKVMTFPPLFFVGQLYYTDAGGLFFLLMAWFLRDRHHVVLSLISSAIALWFRQTNAIWVLFVGGSGFVQRMQPFVKNPLDPRDYAKALFAEEFKLFRAIMDFAGDFFIPLAYLVFVFVSNGGHIVHGDKDNHQLSQHWAQLCYFAVVVLGSSGLAFELVLKLRTTMRSFLAHSGLFMICLAVSVGFIRRFSITHPFLLADNRHFSFYLWSKVFRAHEMAKYAPVPIYAIGLFFGSLELFKATPPLTAFGFLLACVLSLVPLPLFEPRYFIVPLTFYTILTAPQKDKRSGDLATMLTIAIHLALNAGVAWLFWFRPFKWGDGSVARFMW